MESSSELSMLRMKMTDLINWNFLVFSNGYIIIQPILGYKHILWAITQRNISFLKFFPDYVCFSINASEIVVNGLPILSISTFTVFFC